MSSSQVIVDAHKSVIHFFPSSFFVEKRKVSKNTHSISNMGLVAIWNIGKGYLFCFVFCCFESRSGYKDQPIGRFSPNPSVVRRQTGVVL